MPSESSERTDLLMEPTEFAAAARKYDQLHAQVVAAQFECLAARDVIAKKIMSRKPPGRPRNEPTSGDLEAEQAANARLERAKDELERHFRARFLGMS